MSAFSIKAEGGTNAADLTEVHRALSILLFERHELRRLPGGRHGVVSCDDLDSAVKLAEDMSDGKVYWSINPIKPDCDRANKQNVACRRWLPIDVDTVRPSMDDSSTDAEKAAACEVAQRVADYLLDLGWPPPVMLDSGNGWWLLYRIDLPNDPLSHQIVKDVLYRLADQFDCDEATVDRAIHDAPRICRLPGTMARKGIATPDRPHRMARLVYEPDRLEVVTVEQLKALGELPATEHKNGNGKAPTFTTTATNGPGKDAYVRAAIERECYRVALALKDRNNQLNNSAFALGQFASWPEMNEQEARGLLQRAAERAGLDRDTNCGPHGILATIASGWAAGILNPRPRPVDPGTPAIGGKLAPGVSPIIWGNKIPRRKVEWLWPSRIPFGKQTTFAGQTGVGKTFSVCDIAARVTRGMEIPFQGGLCFEQGTVLFISAEDDADDTILPRFWELGGDPSKIAFLSPEAEDHFSLAALDLLNSSLDAMGKDVKLVVIDPPTSYLGKTDDHRNAELRGLLTPLKRWARDRRVALIFITHVNKGAQNLEALARVMGSAAWVQAVRAAHMFCPHPDNPLNNLFVPLKVNNASKGKALSYVIEPLPSGEAILRWIEEVDVTADEAMSQTRKKSRGQSAVEWLEDKFRQQREWRSDELKNMSREEGISNNALFSPEVLALPIRKRRRIDASGNTFYVWQAEDNWPAGIAAGIAGIAGFQSHKSNDYNIHRGVPICEGSGIAGTPAETQESQLSRQPIRETSEITLESQESQLSRLRYSGIPDRDSSLTPAIRFLAGTLSSKSIPKEEVCMLSDRAYIDLSTLDQAAEALMVERTIEDGIETWRLPP